MMVCMSDLIPGSRTAHAKKRPTLHCSKITMKTPEKPKQAKKPEELTFVRLRTELVFYTKTICCNYSGQNCSTSSEY